MCVGGARVGTFMAVNYKVSLFIPCCDLIRDSVTIGVLSQHRGNQCVGSCILRDEGPVAVNNTDIYIHI